MDKNTYNKSVDILLDAYNQQKLSHGRCWSCAVGQLLGGNSVWGCDFVTTEGEQTTWSKIYRDAYADQKYAVPGINPAKMTNEELREYLDILYSTNGYTREELASIEYAFEMAIWDKELAEEDKDKAEYKYSRMQESKEGQYLGLKAVLELMETMVEEEVESGIERLQTIAHDKYHVVV